MGTVYSDTQTAFNANPPVRVDFQDFGGKVRLYRAKYEAAALVSGEVIEMFNLPVGSKIDRIVMQGDALGSGVTLTLKLGSTTVFNAIVHTSAVATNTDAIAYIDFDGTAITEANKLVTVTTGVGSATGTIRVKVYVTDNN